VTLEITGSRRSLSDPDPKMAESELRSANQYVNETFAGARGNDEDAPEAVVG